MVTQRDSKAPINELLLSEDALEGWFRVDGKYVGRLVYVV